MKKLTYEFVKKQFEKEGYKLLSNKYVGCDQKLKCECSNGHEYSTKWDYWKQGSRCYFCNRWKLSIEFIKSEFAKEDYILLTKMYVNAHQKLEYTCPKGHRHSITWANWSSGHRCPYCNKGIKLDINFIKAAFKREGYILLTRKYEGAHIKLIYICPNKHLGYITWSNWNLGHRCLNCFMENRQDSGNPSWKGGITPFYKKVRKFIKGINWYLEIFERDNYTCQKCGKKGIILNAHHVITVKNILDYYNITTIEEAKSCLLLFDVNNGITLCENCHNWVHSNKNINKMFIEEII